MEFKLRMLLLPLIMSSSVLCVSLYFNENTGLHNIFGLKMDTIILLLLSLTLGIYYFIICAIIPQKKRLIHKIEPFINKTELYIASLAFSAAIPIILFLYETDLVEFNNIWYKTLIFESMLILSAFIPTCFFYILYFSIYKK